MAAYDDQQSADARAKIDAQLAAGASDASYGKSGSYDLRGMGPKAGENYDQWLARLDQQHKSENMFSGGFDSGNKSGWGNAYNYALKNRATLEPLMGGAGQAQQQAEADAAQKEQAFQQWRQDTMTKLSTFANEMNMPVEQLIAKGDLGVQNAGATGRSQASAAAYGAGLGGGGISNVNTQRAVTDAQSKYQLQRAQIGLGATNSLLGNMSDMAHTAEDTRRYNQGLDMQMQQAQQQAGMFQFQQKQNQIGAITGAVGGVAGAYFGGPAGAAAGYGLGSGLGSAAAGTYQTKPYTMPSGLSRPSGSNPFGGSQ